VNKLYSEIDLRDPPTRAAVRATLSLCLRVIARQERGEDISEVKKRMLEAVEKILKPLDASFSE